MKMMFWIMFLLFIPACNAEPQVYEDLRYAGIKDPESVEKFLGNLKEMVREEKKEGIALIINYPIDVFGAKNERITISTSNGFIERYAEIFTEEIKAAILDQAFDEIKVSSRGIMIGPRGEVWLGSFCDKSDCSDGARILIRSINNFHKLQE